MYPNLEAEMARVKMSKIQLAKKIHKSPSVLSQKMAGRVGIEIGEAFEIKEAIGCHNVPLDVLFSKEVVR